MIKPLHQYCRDEVAHRLWAILASSDIVVSLLLAVWLGLMRDGSSVAQLHTNDVGSTGLTYSTIAFGFSLAGLTIALTLPDRQFAKTLAKEHGAFADLLFVFSWTAVVHWCLVVGSIALLTTFGGNTTLLPPGASIERRIVVGMFGFLFAYGVSQFLTAVLTLSQVGRLYIRELLKG